tara:strand:- start:1033 stop:2652 length:1620 start_codon:yes stop_codon:yes gene_type:complete
MSDEDVYRLNRGGHDPFKVYAAYHAAVNHTGRPTVILAKTVKGYATGAGEAVNKTHQMKKLDLESLKDFRDRFDMPFTDEQLEEVPYYRPAEDSAELRYMKEQRDKLGGYMPVRRQKASQQLTIPGLDVFANFLEGSGDREISTTMAFVRMMSTLIKDKQIGERVVPIVPDEARTFGMEGLFRQLGIYSSGGQKYEPEDAGQVMYYREDKKGRILEEGINEAGAMSGWLAAATSYSVHDFTLIPFYIYYSMFGFQRVGDLAWAAGDSQARGFLLGATAGRTTLNGEGLQHQDGHSHILAGTVPNCVSYDPTYSYELAVILQDGLRRMYEDNEKVFYYLTLMNENYMHGAMPEGAEEGIRKGMYLLREGKPKTKKTPRVQLLGSGTILREVEAAADLLREDFGVAADVWSVTSFNELRREGLRMDRDDMLNPEKDRAPNWVEKCLEGRAGPVIASTDYMRAFADQIRPWVKAPYSVLGTDGFGRSDSRQKLRHFFEVDRYFVVLAALNALRKEGKVDAAVVKQAIEKYGIDTDKPYPVMH